ncbi:MAG: hypothetical protein RIT36_1394, partial [Bacteroidota bacterium]
MLYQLYQWLIQEQLRFPGMGIFQFITFRAMLAVLLSLFITLVYGKHIILFLQKMQVGESVRELGLQGEEQKKGTPTMGGFIILLGILIPTLLFANLDKVYIKLLLLSTIWLGLVGFVDDYLKLRSKRMAQRQGVNYKKGDKDGLAGWFKVLGQVGLGVIISATLLFNDNVKVMREYKGKVKPANAIEVKYQGGVRYFVKANEPVTTIPFIKDHEFNYAKLLPASLRSYGWVVYMLVIIFIVTAVSNGANITDGLDGLATGVSALIGACLALFTYASGNLIFADYLNIMYIPNLGEVSVFIAAMIG